MPAPGNCANLYLSAEHQKSCLTELFEDHLCPEASSRYASIKAVSSYDMSVVHMAKLKVRNSLIPPAGPSAEFARSPQKAAM